MFSSKRERSGADLLPRSEEAFAERLDMLASTVSSTAAAIARTDGDIVGLRRELGNGLARLEELVAEMRSLARASDLRELEKKVGTLSFEHGKTPDSKRLDDLGSKVAVLAERVDTLASTVAMTAGSIAGRDGEVAALRRQLGEGSHGPAVDEELLRRVEDVAAASASASMRLESHGERIAELTIRAESLDEGLAAIAQRVEVDEKERVAFAASVTDAAAARWREIERALGELADKVGAAEERANAISAELARATSLWPTALRALETKVEELANAPHPVAEVTPQPAADTHVLVALRTLEQRLQRADAAAHEEREAVLERLERLSGQLDERLEPMPIAAEIVPFRTDP